MAAVVGRVDLHLALAYRSAMPPLEAFGPTFVVGLLLLVMLWFAFGTQYNVRKGNRILAWLQSGLPQIGRRTTLRWLGSSVVELCIAEASAPFRDATVMVVLEPRDVGLLWAWARLRGRRDFLIVRANLRRPPLYSVDVGDSRGWTGNPSESVGAGLSRIDWPGEGYVRAFANRDADAGPARLAWTRLAHNSDGVWRLTVQPVVPHLEVHIRPPTAETSSADELLAPIRELAVALGR
jgi:hypothetical protein